MPSNLSDASSIVTTNSDSGGDSFAVQVEQSCGVPLASRRPGTDIHVPHFSHCSLLRPSPAGELDTGFPPFVGVQRLAEDELVHRVGRHHGAEVTLYQVSEVVADRVMRGH